MTIAPLIVDLSLRYGGADVRVLALAQAFAERGIRYNVAVLDDSDIQHRLASEGLNYVIVPHGKGNPLVAPFMRGLINKEKYTVVDAHNPQSQLWSHTATLGMKGVQRVSTIHSSYRLEHDGSVKGHSYEQIIRLNAMQNCRFISVSEAVHDYLRQTVGLDDKRIMLIHNSIVLPENPQPNKAHPLIQEIGWQDKTIVVVVGRIETVKGHEFLFRALKSVKPIYSQLRCLIVGEGRIRDVLEAQVAEAKLDDIVHFAGFRNDVNTILSACEIFAIPSLSEGLPYALLEAASQKVPILASKVGGMAELLTHMQNAYLIPPSDTPALAEALRWMLDNVEKRQAMAEAAYTLVKDTFSMETMLEQTLAIYQELA
ncbi:MAG: glycosyltransferase family 4 protein [Anaerolineae bacterium]|nr:glycosyltransferase family 4 protein [Anaerolineae bacterium]